jgi:hypothetical protein
MTKGNIFNTTKESRLGFLKIRKLVTSPSNPLVITDLVVKGASPPISL